jgi:flavin-dependent dehydrogenase
MSARFDLAVLGAGPAGAAAALGAARAGLAVALFDPQTGPLDKPCGEGIMPAGVAALQELGLDALVRSAAPLARLRYVLAGGRELPVEFPRPGCALERRELTAALDQALAREPRVTRLACRVRTERHAHGFELVHRSWRWHARTLVAADGLRGEGAGWLRAEHVEGTRYGLRARALARTPLDAIEVHLGRTCELYLTPLPRGRVNIAVLADERPAGLDPRAWLAQALAEHPRAAAKIGARVTEPEARALGRRAALVVAEDGAFLAGDATGGVDPVLGGGVALALVTGLAAGRAAAARLAGGGSEIERGYARLVARETRVRRSLARGLVFLAGRPHLQAGVVELLTRLPVLVRGVARRVAG